MGLFGKDKNPTEKAKEKVFKGKIIYRQGKITFSS